MVCPFFSLPSLTSKQDLVEFAAACVSESDAKLGTFLDTTFDKWHMQANGNLFAGGPKLKALNRTVVEQVRSIMADEDSAMKRVRLKRSQYRVIGSLHSASAHVHEHRPPAEDGDDDEANVNDTAEKYDAEIEDLWKAMDDLIRNPMQ